MTRPGAAAAAFALLAALFLLTWDAAARGPIRLDISAAPLISCPDPDMPAALSDCPTEYVGQFAGLRFTFIPDRTPPWGQLTVETPAGPLRDTGNGVICFPDTLTSVGAASVPTSFWFATPDGIVTYDWTGAAYRRGPPAPGAAC